MADLHRLPPPLVPLATDPAGAAVLTDFDGTLAATVPDPELAVPVAGAVEMLEALARRLAVVGVVSGRPVSFLERHLSRAGTAVALYGGYGVEWARDGERGTDPALAPWTDRVAALTETARSGAPAGLGIEPKGWALTLHWRQDPSTAAWARSFAADAAGDGFELQPGRMAVEIRPPSGVDKGTVVTALGAPCRAVCFAGDDAGDLAAFDALDRLAAGGVHVVRLAVADEESPPALLERADVVVTGPHEAVTLLGALAEAVG